MDNEYSMSASEVIRIAHADFLAIAEAEDAAAATLVARLRAGSLDDPALRAEATKRIETLEGLLKYRTVQPAS